MLNLNQVTSLVVLITALVQSCGSQTTNLPRMCDVTTWPPSNDIDSEAEVEAAIAALRCSLGCQNLTWGGSLTEDHEGACINGCLLHSQNTSLSLNDCNQACLVQSEPTLCQLRCNVSSQFIAPPECLLDTGGVLRVGQRAFVSSAEGVCIVLACGEDQLLNNLTLHCGSLNDVSCSLVGEDEINATIARCCGFCEGEEAPMNITTSLHGLPMTPSAPLSYNVTNSTLLLHLPPINYLLTTAAQSVLVRVRGNQRNTTVIPLLDITQRTVSVEVTQPACSQLVLDYATVNLRGASSFSPPTTITVVPSAVEHIRVTGFSEESSLPRHASLELVWTAPQEFPHLMTDYEVTIAPTSKPGEHRAARCEDRLLYTTDLKKDTSSLSLSASNTEEQLLPLYGCRYVINVTTFPGLATASELVDIKYTRADNQALNMTCSAQYIPETVSYDITVVWEIDPLAAAAVSKYQLELRDRNGLFFVNSTEVKDKLITTFTGVEVKTSGGYFVELWPVFNSTYFWRRPLLPPKTNPARCPEITTPPHPPSSITHLNMTDVTNSIQGELLVISMVVSWEGPLYTNGVLREFILRVGSCEEGRLVQQHWTRELIQPETRELPVSTIAIPLSASNDLCIQIRSRNQFAFSNWSTPFTLTLAPPLENTPPPDTLPLYASAMIGVCAVLVVVGALFVSLIVLAVCLRKHRGVKFDPLFISMTNPSNSSFKRTFGPRSSISSQCSRILFPTLPAPPPIVDQWEIPYHELKVFDSQPLGSGAFGEVFKGHVSSQVIKAQPFGTRRMSQFSVTCTVAVKKLKGNATSSEKVSFLKEIDMMKRVTDSENEYSRFVVNMIGCVTVQEPFLLVLEYVKYGDLLKYLRAMKVKLRDAQVAASYVEPEGTYSRLIPRDVYEDLDLLEKKDLLEFSRQIAAGMEYLSSLDIIHRDLACRNILVGNNKNLKISDFGMSRHMPNEEAYVLTSHGQLPLRWMALESIFRREFTTASDVWSYGIVLWEICTMGDLPYPVHTNREVVEQLKGGYRIPRPCKCSSEVYEVMLHCWCEKTEDRPSFSELRQRFDHFLSLHVQEHHPYIEIPDEPYQFDRLAPETGQMGRNSLLDDGETPLNLDQLEGNDGPGESRAPLRESMLSDTMEVLNISSILDHTHCERVMPHCTQSPNNSQFISELSIEGDLLQQLDRRLSIISVNRLQAKLVAARKNEEEFERGIVVDKSTRDCNVANGDISWPVCLKESSETAPRETEDKTEKKEEVDGPLEPFERTESLLERKKRDYFKFTLIPTCGVQYSSEAPHGNREVLI